MSGEKLRETLIPDIFKPVGNAGNETRTGGDRREFPSTSWSLIVGLQASTLERRREALEALCERYWKPVYHFARRAFSKTPEDAKDLAQGFFLDLFQDGAIESYQPKRGSLRAFLKTLLRRFAADVHDMEKARKRGGGRRIVPLDAEDRALKDVVPDERVNSPEAALDWSWRKEVLERAVERVREGCEARGRQEAFRCFEAYDLMGEGRTTYADVAARLGVSESDVRNHLFAVRERLREEIRAELAQTVTDPEALEREWLDLFGA